MDLRNEITVNAPAGVTWEVLGERFHHMGAWAAPITSSCPVGDDRPGVGATRACHHPRFGPFEPGTVKERLISFDRETMAFEYEAIEGMPSFVARAVNCWSVHPVDEQSCLVRIHATLTLRGPIVLFSWLLRWQMKTIGARVAEELKHYVEHGRPHPRKAAAVRRASAPSAGASLRDPGTEPE